ncbi:hypothetical protein ABTD55_23585, partial [Acinetobacter baumannii]
RLSFIFISRAEGIQQHSVTRATARRVSVKSSKQSIQSLLLAMRLFAQYISRALTKLSSISIVWKLSLQRSQEKYCTGTM